MEKLYYSISEVSEILGVTRSRISAFGKRSLSNSNPNETPKERVFILRMDIDVVKRIMFLVNDQRLTLEGAKRRLGQQRDVVQKQQVLADRLRKIRAELKAIAAELSH